MGQFQRGSRYIPHQEETLIEKFIGGAGPGWTFTIAGGNTLSFYWNGFSINAPVSISNDVWHEFAVEKSGNTFELFLDGNPLAFASDVGATVTPSSNPLLIGARNASDVRNFTVNGLIDNVGIWNQALSFGQIASSWNNGAGTQLSLTTTENTPLTINGITASLAPGDSDDTVSLSLSVGHGTLALGNSAGLASYSAGSTLVFSGTQSEISTALGTGVIYTPTSEYDGTDTLTVFGTDTEPQNGSTASTATQSLNLIVQSEAPVFVGTTLEARTVGKTVSLGATIAAADANDTLGNVTVTGLPGDLSNFSGGTYNTTTGIWYGTAAQFNALTFNDGTTTGTFNLSISAVTAGAGAASATENYALTVVAGWTGDTLDEVYYFPNLGTVYYTSPNFVVPASGIAGYSGAPFQLSVNANSITASYTQNGSWFSASFNGFQVNDLSHSIISGVTLDSSSNMAGLSTGNISFGSNFVRVNWQGLSFSTSTVVKLDLTFDPPLDPSQMSVAQTLDGTGSPASNTRTLTVADGTELALAGTIDNSGAIAVNGASAATAIGINGNVTLDGGGQIDLSASNENYIFGNGTLTNIDNTISGSGDLGNGTLSLENAGFIEAQGPYALIIDTGSNPFVNTGAMDTGGGTLTVDSPVTGGGNAVITGGTLEFSAASDNNVSFTGGGMGTLALDQSRSFTGTVAGFGGQDQIDLGDIAYSDVTTTLDYWMNADNSGGTLTVSDGTHTANLGLLGQYAASSFAMTSDGHGGTLITEAAAIAQNQPMQPHA